MIMTVPVTVMIRTVPVTVMIMTVPVTVMTVPVIVVTVAGREVGHAVGASSPGRGGRSSSSAA